jgi:hypothetical protein
VNIVKVKNIIFIQSLIFPRKLLHLLKSYFKIKRSSKGYSNQQRISV